MKNSLLIQVWIFPFMLSAEDGSEWLNRLCVLFSNEKKLRTFVDDNVSCWWILSSEKLYNTKRRQPLLTWDFKWLMLVLLSLSRNISTVFGFWLQQVKSRPNSSTVPIWSRIQHTKVISSSLIHFFLFFFFLKNHFGCIYHVSVASNGILTYSKHETGITILKWPLIWFLWPPPSVFLRHVLLWWNIQTAVSPAALSLSELHHRPQRTTGQEYLSINKHSSFLYTVSD